MQHKFAVIDPEFIGSMSPIKSPQEWVECPDNDKKFLASVGDESLKNCD